MPIYDYQCGACETVFEAEHAMTERPKLRCPKCRSTRTSKVFNAASVQFKTGGFYITDSRPKGKEGGTETTGESSSETKPEPKADSNAETKPETKKTEPVSAT